MIHLLYKYCNCIVVIIPLVNGIPVCTYTQSSARAAKPSRFR